MALNKIEQNSRECIELHLVLCITVLIERRCKPSTVPLY